MRRSAASESQLSLGLRYTLEDVVGAVPACDHVWAPREGINWEDRTIVSWRCVTCRAIGGLQKLYVEGVGMVDGVLPRRCELCCCAAWGVNFIGRDTWCSKHTREKVREAHRGGCAWRRHVAEIQEALRDRDRTAALTRGFVRTSTQVDVFARQVQVIR